MSATGCSSKGVSAGWWGVHRHPKALRKSGPGFVREGSLPPPRPPERVQREMLFRILLQSPSLIDEVAEEFAALDMPEAELDRLRREILEIEALHPGLEAPRCGNTFT